METYNINGVEIQYDTFDYFEYNIDYGKFSMFSR